MKFVTVVLALVLCLIIVGPPSPVAQADDSKAEVKVKVKVVAPISVTTRFAWPVGYRVAVLHGRLTDMGTDSSVYVYFEWGETKAYGSKTRVRRLTHTGRFFAVIYGLTPGTTYHFRAVAEGDGNIFYGDELKFTTKKWWHWWWWWRHR